MAMAMANDKWQRADGRWQRAKGRSKMQRADGKGRKVVPVAGSAGSDFCRIMQDYAGICRTRPAKSMSLWPNDLRTRFGILQERRHLSSTHRRICACVNQAAPAAHHPLV